MILEFDYIVIGSGFGGSVSAMRLSEKGYKVLIIEKGKRWGNNDFPKSSWNLRKFLWIPSLRCFGIMKMNFINKLLVLSGAGVGGGSLVYGNVHMIPDEQFWESDGWQIKKNWKSILWPFYERAKYMLGSTIYQKEFYEDKILRDVAIDMNRGSTYRAVDYVGIYFSEDQKAKDPYFGGKGPKRSPCIECAGCMIGCRHNAKNSLDKNYLWFAEKYGATILPETLVTKIEYVQGKYKITTKTQTKLFGKAEQEFIAKGLICSAGVLGTVKLLLRQRDFYKTLPGLSNQLGHSILTNQEMIAGIGYTPYKLNHGIAISRMFQPDRNTFVELCKYPNGSGTMFKLGLPAAGPGPIFVRMIKSFLQWIRNPLTLFKIIFHPKTANSSIILLVMQSLPGKLKLGLKSFWWGTKLKIDKDFQENISSYLPIGQEVMLKYAQKSKGIPLNAFNELLFGMNTTAHILGGCPIGPHSATSVVNELLEVHNYPNMYIIDGSIIPANLGVNPSLTIAAMAEYAMDSIPNKKQN
ncbi:MAG: GMC family oxidoreductase [Saprospiraceae bacterium]|nr:GMC family oxidoreductase [Saprospiraceae bacterium]